MMNLSKTAGYAVHALCCLETAGGKSLFVRDIAERTGIAKPYLARIIHRLACSGLILSKRGYRGGVVLSRPATQITLHQIAEAVEGAAWSRQCFFGLDRCPSQGVCPTHNMWSAVRAQIEGMLRRTSLAEVARATQPPATQKQTTTATGRSAPTRTSAPATLPAAAPLIPPRPGPPALLPANP